MGRCEAAELPQPWPPRQDAGRVPSEGVIASNGVNLVVYRKPARGKTAGVWVSDSIGRGGRIISESGAAMIGVGFVRAESYENCRPARKFPHKLCYAEAE